MPEIAASGSEARGHVALAENNFLWAAESLREALDRWTEQSRPYDQIRTFNVLSRALLESGDDTEARAACDQALEIVETLALQLDDEDLKTSSLNSALVQEIRNRRDQFA